MARTQGSRAEITGPAIRAAAQHLFARHGYAAVSMRQIAAQVGVQAGTLYSYTPDKQTLLAGLLRDHMEHLLSSWRDAPEADALTRLDRFVRFHIAMSLDNPDAVFLSYMELRNLTSENHAAIAALRRRYENLLEQILRDGQAAGLMRPGDTRLGTMALIAMMTGVTHWFRDTGRLDREGLIGHYTDLARGAVGADGDRLSA
ncbi:MAG: TetR/AcrR family transcriptional regulator [Paracoccus sp. (in: a-proteobacteria)]|nr:TetR/AcrR family transcriptional regulator [Paracoccus sp. (in: a-proteobacteria)]